MPSMPAGAEEGILKGMYRLSSVEAKGEHRVQLFGSGAILRSVLEAQKILADEFEISSDVWSVTSYTQLRREAQDCRRHNLLHPTQPPRVSYVEQCVRDVSAPFIAASDYVCALAEQVSPWIPGGLLALGTDGLGRSETREALRRHFEVDAQCVTIAALWKLSQLGKISAKVVEAAITSLHVDTEKINPLFA